MRRSRLFATFAAVMAVALFGFAGPAQADPADDAAIMAENLPAAAEELVAAIEAAAETFGDTQSFDAAAQSLLVSPPFGNMNGVPSVVNELVAGTEQFGALGLGSALAANAVYSVVAPILAGLDDPAALGDAINPDDISVIVDALPAAAEEAGDHAVTSVAALVQGNLVGGSSGIGIPSGVGNGLSAAMSLLSVFEDTEFVSISNAGTVVLLIGAVALGEDLVEAEESLAPVFEPLAPVTGPLAEALQGS